MDRHIAKHIMVTESFMIYKIPFIVCFPKLPTIIITTSRTRCLLDQTMQLWNRVSRDTRGTAQRRNIYVDSLNKV